MKALWIAIAVAGCGPPAAPPVTGAAAPGRAAVDAGDAPARLDALVEHWLAELDRAEAATPRGPALDPAIRIRVPLTADGSPPAAAVTITYFHELACKFCEHARAVIAELDRRYHGRIGFVPRTMIVHRVPAMTAHLVACAAARRGHDPTEAIWDRAFPAHDYSSATLLGLAADAGVPAADVLAELGTGACFASIRDDDLLARRVGIRGTPTFVIDGIPIEGLAGTDELAALIDAELARADAFIAAGGDVPGFHAAWWSTARDPR